MKFILKTKLDKLLFFLLLCFTINSCSHKLNFSEIKERINEDYISFNENDIEYEFQNTPVKYLKEYGSKGYKRELLEISKSRNKDKYRPHYSDIGELKVQDRKKCNSTYFYTVKYLVDKIEITPYLDSIALKLNYEDYGKENVHFNSNSKILQVRKRIENIIFLDKDRKWKLLKVYSFDDKIYDRIFGKDFVKCVKEKSESSDYLPY